jgi:hypothetical protein
MLRLHAPESLRPEPDRLRPAAERRVALERD